LNIVILEGFYCIDFWGGVNFILPAPDCQDPITAFTRTVFPAGQIGSTWP
jgi:hypothetical protein